MNKKMKVIGATSGKVIYVLNEGVFSNNEYIKVKDVQNDNPIGVVSRIHRFLEVEDVNLGGNIKSYLKECYKDLNNFSIAEVNILNSLSTPIMPNASVVYPEFSEIKSFLINGNVDKNFVLGEILGTENTFETVPSKYSDLFNMFNGLNSEYIDQKNIPFILNHYSFQQYPHIGLFGSSGSGKTHALRVLLEENLKKDIPGLVLDPHYELTFDVQNKDIKSKFKQNLNNKFKVFTVGEDVGIDFTDISSTEIVTLLKFLSNIPKPTMSIIDATHKKGESFSAFINKIEKLREVFEYQEKNYQEKKQNPISDDLSILYAKYKTKISGTASLQALLWRLNQLKKIGIFDKNIKPIESAIKKRKTVVIRGRDIHVKMLSEYMFSKLYAKRRDYKDWQERRDLTDNYIPDKFPPFNIILDEAHNYAPSKEDNPLKEKIIEIALEARKYGVFLTLGTQRPARLDATVFAQLNTKFIFRITSKNDMNRIKMETNLSENQARRLPDIKSGNAFVASPLLVKTTLIRFRATITTSPHSVNPFDELSGFVGNEELNKKLLTILPFTKKEITDKINLINKGLSEYYSIDEIYKKLDEMVENNEIKRDKSIFEERYYL